MKKTVSLLLCVLLLCAVLCACDTQPVKEQTAPTVVTPTLRPEATIGDDPTQEPTTERLNGEAQLVISESIVEQGGRRQPTGVNNYVELKESENESLSFTLGIPLEFSISKAGKDTVQIELLGEAEVDVPEGQKIGDEPINKKAFTLKVGESVTVVLAALDATGYYTFTIEQAG